MIISNKTTIKKSIAFNNHFTALFSCPYQPELSIGLTLISF